MLKSSSCDSINARRRRIMDCREILMELFGAKFRVGLTPARQGWAQELSSGVAGSRFPPSLDWHWLIEKNMKNLRVSRSNAKAFHQIGGICCSARQWATRRHRLQAPISWATWRWWCGLIAGARKNFSGFNVSENIGKLLARSDEEARDAATKLHKRQLSSWFSSAWSNRRLHTFEAVGEITFETLFDPFRR